MQQLTIMDTKRIDRWNKLLSTIKTRMSVPVMAKILKVSKDTLRDDCIDLAKMGYISVEDLPLNRGRAVGFLPIKDKFDMKDYVPFEKRQRETYTKQSQPLEMTGTLPNSRIIRQVDKVYWTPKAKQHMEVRRGSTLGSMTF